MPKKSKKSKFDASSIAFEDCKFIPASSLPISEDGHENINNCGNVTFGDANRTLFTIDRLLDRVTFDNQNDVTILEEISKVHGHTTYIDLEN